MCRKEQKLYCLCKHGCGSGFGCLVGTGSGPVFRKRSKHEGRSGLNIRLKMTLKFCVSFKIYWSKFIKVFSLNFYWKKSINGWLLLGGFSWRSDPDWFFLVGWIRIRNLGVNLKVGWCSAEKRGPHLSISTIYIIQGETDTCTRIGHGACIRW